MRYHIGVDLDNVLRDFIPSVYREYVKDYPERERYLTKPENFGHYNLSKMSSDEEIGEHLIHLSLKDPEFSFRVFRNADPLPGQVSQLRSLYEEAKEHDDRVTICTAQPEPWKRDATLQWMVEHDVPHDDVILTGSGKDHFGLDCIFDDRVKNCKAVERTGSFAVLKRRNHNYDSSYPLQAEQVKQYKNLIYEHTSFTRNAIDRV